MFINDICSNEFNPIFLTKCKKNSNLITEYRKIQKRLISIAKYNEIIEDITPIFTFKYALV